MSKPRTRFGLFVFVLFLGLATAAPGSAKDVEVQSVWAAKALVIDGLAGDWAGKPLSIHGGTKTEFAFRNDADNLYILLEFKDPLFLSTLEKTGVTVYWCAPGQNKKDNGLKFSKLVLSADELIARRRGQGRKLTDAEIAAIKAKPIHTLLMYDMVNKKERAKMASAKPSLYPDFNAAREGKGWIYEIKVPLARNENQPFGVGAAPGGVVRVGVEWGGRTEAPTQQETQFMRTLSERDAPGQDSQIRKGQPKYTFWLDVGLAATPR
jgi:hypothetical protein